jgi:hypothetical protein
MKKKRSKLKVKQPSPVTAAATAAPSASGEETMSAKLERAMKSLAETAQKTSDPMELLRALSKIVPLGQRK